MRNIFRADTLERRFPLLAVERGCIISKSGDITIAFRVELPEIYTLSSAEYEAIHSAWIKAIKVLPNYTIIHKQDWFTEDRYQTEASATFLGRSFEQHFDGRPYLHHTCYLFVTKTTKEQSRTQSTLSTLCRGHILPKEINKETMANFREAVGQFECIINDCGAIKLSRLSELEIVGSSDNAGVIERYFALSQSDATTLEDLTLNPNEMRVGDNILSLHTLSEVDDLPSSVSTDIRYERLSTERSDCRLSFASPVSLLLDCNHIYNQFIFIDDSAETLRSFERTARNMHALSRYSRANQINKEWLDEYLNSAHSMGLTSVRAHCNVIAWSDDRAKLKRIKNDVGAAIALMGCKPRHNTIDLPTLYWAAIPGNAGDFPSEESFYTFLEQGVALFCEESNYKSSSSKFGLKLCDRSGRPIHLDISDLPMQRGVITNRNKFVLGGSGTGKSFWMLHFLRFCYEQMAHIMVVDVGNSYSGLCRMIHQMTDGNDGIYYTYTEATPISFNPFYSENNSYDVEKKESLKTLLMTLWKGENETITKTESAELGSAVSGYIEMVTSDKSISNNFNSFYEFMRDTYHKDLDSRAIKVTREEFNIDNFLTTTKQYYRGGRYDFLLNSEANIDLLNKRFVVFEIDSLKDNKELFPVVTIIIMEAFIGKMRKLKGERKILVIEEAWKALSTPSMADYIRYLYKTVRKHFGEAIVVTQEVDDIISSPIVKDAIINNSDCKILLDQRRSINKFEAIQNLLGLSEKERAQILSINLANDPNRNYKEVWIGLGGKQSAVYATEVSQEEYLLYTTEESEKLEVERRIEQHGGDIEAAIYSIINDKL